MGNYIATLYRMQDCALVDYDSIRITADSEEDAMRQAQEWAAVNLGIIEEPTWLQVTDLSDKAILYKPYGTINA
jgi:hypothetical protein